MGFIDALWHLLNLVAPAVGLGLIASVAAKLAWRRGLASVRWQQLAWRVSLANTVVLMAGLALTGHDGRMSTYGAMVLASAAALWWHGAR